MKRILFILTVSIICLSGCSSATSSAESATNMTEIQYESNDTSLRDLGSFTVQGIHSQITRWIDPDTGVEYLVIYNAGVVKGISPRYNSFGELIIHKKSELQNVDANQKNHDKK